MKNIKKMVVVLCTTFYLHLFFFFVFWAIICCCHSMLVMALIFLWAPPVPSSCSSSLEVMSDENCRLDDSLTLDSDNSLGLCVLLLVFWPVLSSWSTSEESAANCKWNYYGMLKLHGGFIDYFTEHTSLLVSAWLDCFLALLFASWSSIEMFYCRY